MKRTELKRRSPLRAKAPAKAEVPTSRCKAKGCRVKFARLSMNHRACSVECARLVVADDKAKQARKDAQAAADDKRKTRAQLEALKSLSELRAEAQTEFNRYIRARDKAAGYACICCGEPLDWNSTKPGGAVDAGHYVSRGSAPELAFDERNVNAQRKGCNRPGGAKRDDFRAGMVGRWGQAVVNELEGPTPPARLRHDDYRAIKAEYRRKAREVGKT